MSILKQSEENFKEIPAILYAKYAPSKLLWQTPYCKVYSARSRENQSEEYFIKMLNFSSEHVSHNYDFAVTFFIRELLFLSSRLGQEGLMIQDFQIENKLVGCAMKPYQRLGDVTKENFQVADLEKLMKDISADLEFFSNNMNFPMSKIVGYDNIFKLKDSDTFFLSNWDEFILMNSKTVLQNRMNGTNSDKIASLLQEKQQLARIIHELKLNRKQTDSIGNEFASKDKMDVLKPLQPSKSELLETESKIIAPTENNSRLTYGQTFPSSLQKVVWTSYESNHIEVYDILTGEKSTDLYGRKVAGRISCIFFL